MLYTAIPVLKRSKAAWRLHFTLEEKDVNCVCTLHNRSHF